MRFQVYCRHHFPTSRRTAALKLIHETMKSEKNKLDKTFGVRDWSILLKYVYFDVSSFCTYVRSSDGPHNSDRRPRAYRRSEGDHWSLWGFAFRLEHSVFYMHIHADQSAMIGPDTRKILLKELCDLLGSGEVGIIRFLPIRFQDLHSNLDIQRQQILNLVVQQSFLCLLWIKSSSVMSVQSTCVWFRAQFGFSQWHHGRRRGQPTNYHQCNQIALAMSQTTHRGHNGHLSPRFHTTSLISSFNYDARKTRIFGKRHSCLATQSSFRSSTKSLLHSPSFRLSLKGQD